MPLKNFCETKISFVLNLDKNIIFNNLDGIFQHSFIKSKTS